MHLMRLFRDFFLFQNWIDSVFLIHLMFVKYIHHGDHILNVVKLVVMEKKQEQEPALVEYAHVPQHKIWFKRTFARRKIVSLFW